MYNISLQFSPSAGPTRIDGAILSFARFGAPISSVIQSVTTKNIRQNTRQKNMKLSFIKMLSLDTNRTIGAVFPFVGNLQPENPVLQVLEYHSISQNYMFS